MSTDTEIRLGTLGTITRVHRGHRLDPRPCRNHPPLPAQTPATLPRRPLSAPWSPAARKRIPGSASEASLTRPPSLVGLLVEIGENGGANRCHPRTYKAAHTHKRSRVSRGAGQGARDGVPRAGGGLICWMDDLARPGGRVAPAAAAHQQDVPTRPPPPRPRICKRARARQRCRRG